VPLLAEAVSASIEVPAAVVARLSSNVRTGDGRSLSRGHRCRPFEVPLITATTRYDLDSGPASQCTRHFAQVGRIVGVEASPACRLLNGAIGRDEHQDWIANRVTIADPG